MGLWPPQPTAALESAVTFPGLDHAPIIRLGGDWSSRGATPRSHRHRLRPALAGDGGLGAPGCQSWPGSSVGLPSCRDLPQRPVSQTPPSSRNRSLISPDTPTGPAPLSFTSSPHANLSPAGPSSHGILTDLKVEACAHPLPMLKHRHGPAPHQPPSQMWGHLTSSEPPFPPPEVSRPLAHLNPMIPTVPFPYTVRSKGTGTPILEKRPTGTPPPNHFWGLYRGNLLLGRGGERKPLSTEVLKSTPTPPPDLVGEWNSLFQFEAPRRGHAGSPQGWGRIRE